MSDLHDGSESSGEQILGGILEDPLQTHPHGAIIPVPAGVHQSALQFVSVCLQYLEQRQGPKLR